MFEKKFPLHMPKNTIIRMIGSRITCLPLPLAGPWAPSFNPLGSVEFPSCPSSPDSSQGNNAIVLALLFTGKWAERYMLDKVVLGLLGRKLHHDDLAQVHEADILKDSRHTVVAAHAST